MNVLHKKRNGLKQPSQDKENVPPLGIKPKRKQCMINRCITFIRKGKWTNEALEKVMYVIENGPTSLK